MQITRYHLPLIPVLTLGAGILFLIIGLLSLSLAHTAAASFTSIISMLGIFLIGLGIVLFGGRGK